MILFQNWNIEYIGGLFARQYDNLSRTLEVTGVPEGYDYRMMVQVGENFDILSLSPMEGGVGVVLTANQLSIAGYYKLQLVGTLRSDGVTKRHTNVLQVYVPGSLSGDANWPTVPSEFSQVEANIRELNSHPPIPGDNGYWLTWDLESHGYTESEFPLPEVATGTGGANDHSKLTNRDADNQHPMSAITGLKEALDGKQPAGDYLTQEIDPTVPSWAKAPTKPSYTATEVGADPSGTAVAQVAAHNTGEAAHSDIRLLIQGLTDRINALADSDDTTLDQLSEIVAYIKSNRDLISSITTSKVSVTDIVDDLVTNVADKPLSAAQGVALKALIDAISLPSATAEDEGKTPVVQADGSYGLGRMIPAPETAEVGQTIVVKAVDENGKPTEWEVADLPKPDEYVVLFRKTFETAVANTGEWGGESHHYGICHFWTIDTDGNAVYADGIFFRIHVPAQKDNIVSSGELRVRVGQCAVTDWNSWNGNEPKPYIGWASFVPATGQEVWAEQNCDLREQIWSGARVTNKTYQDNFAGTHTERTVPFSYALGLRNIEYFSGVQIDLASGSLPAGTEILIYARKYDANKIKNIPKWGAT